MRAAPDVGGDRAAEPLVPGKRQVAVRVVVVDRGPGRLDGGGQWPEIRVEVLEPQQLRVARTVGGVAHAVDADAGNAVETRDGHAQLRPYGRVSTASRPCPVPTRETGTPRASSTKRTYDAAASGSSVPAISSCHPGSVSQTGRQWWKSD